MKAEKVSQFLKYISQWASIQSDIQALALVGSHASGTAKETSDVDLVIITDDPGQYLCNLLWIERFGTVHKQQVIAGGMRILFERGGILSRHLLK